MQKFVAGDWPLRIWSGIVVAAWLAGFVRIVQWNRPSHWLEIVLLVLVAAASFVVVGCGLILTGIRIAPIYLFQATRNGGPFEPGDEVRILTGPARGRIVRVYSAWQGNSVRVDFGEEAKQSFKDIYGAYQVQRVSGSS